MKFEPPPSPIRRARTAPAPSPCSSRKARTRSRTRSGGFVKPVGVSRRSRRRPSCDPTQPMSRRRLYLMRHAEVSYFRADGSPVNPAEVPLNEDGHRAGARGRRRRSARSTSTAWSRAAFRERSRPRDRRARPSTPESWPELREIQGGRLSEIPADALEREFVHAFRGVIPNDDAVPARRVDRRALRPGPPRRRAARRRRRLAHGARRPATAASTGRSSPTRSPASGCSSATSSRRRRASTCSTSETAASGSCGR